MSVSPTFTCSHLLSVSQSLYILYLLQLERSFQYFSHITRLSSQLQIFAEALRFFCFLHFQGLLWRRLRGRQGRCQGRCQWNGTIQPGRRCMTFCQVWHGKLSFRGGPYRCTAFRTISAPSLTFIMWSLLTEAGQAMQSRFSSNVCSIAGGWFKPAISDRKRSN